MHAMVEASRSQRIYRENLSRKIDLPRYLCVFHAAVVDTALGVPKRDIHPPARRLVALHDPDVGIPSTRWRITDGLCLYSWGSLPFIPAVPLGFRQGLFACWLQILAASVLDFKVHQREQGTDSAYIARSSSERVHKGGGM